MRKNNQTICFRKAWAFPNAFMDDSSREIRAMTMASFPCPPLPVVGADVFGDTQTVNSHDLLAFLINTAARRDVLSENEQRVLQQQRLIESYQKSISNSIDPWSDMTRFTRDYMMTYSPAMHNVRFLPFDASTPPVKAQVCSWLAAQHILQDKQARAGQFKDLSHDALYRTCARVNCQEMSG
jgi:hypothetical protein